MMVALKRISGKVGGGATNSSSDVKTVQTLLNKFTSQAGFSKLKEDGAFGPRTEAALQAFQRKVMNASSPKKVIEPGGDVLKHLNARIRDLKKLAKGWVGIDLEDDGVTEVLFLCHRPGESYLDLYLGQPGAAKQTWHGSVDLYQNLGFWNCGKWKF